MINTDALAEMHYSKYDPAYYYEEKIEMEKAEIESRALKAFEHAVKQCLWTMDECELQALAENRDSICEWIEELLGEYE